MTSPYEERDGWELNVMFRNGTLYFEEHSSEEKLVEKYALPNINNVVSELTMDPC